MDLKSSIDATITYGQTIPVPTGLRMAIPEGWEGVVKPRSGLASCGLHIANSPGTIDSDYRGEVKVLLENTAYKPFEIKKGDRIAQFEIQPVYEFRFVEVSELPETERGTGGFGSTGK